MLLLADRKRRFYDNALILSDLRQQFLLNGDPKNTRFTSGSPIELPLVRDRLSHPEPTV
jgi:hypothetical protein